MEKSKQSMPAVTLADLEQYRAQKRELLLLIERIERIQAEARAVTVDSVSGSLPNYPYTKTTFFIEGASPEKTKRSAQVLKVLEKRKEALHTKQLEIEKFIAAIPESVIRQIVELRYIRGKAWGITSTIIYGYPCEGRARKKITRYLETNCKQ